LAAPNSGLLNKIFRSVTGAEQDSHLFNIYTVQGIIFVISCYTFPTSSCSCQFTRPHAGELEDASSILGAGAGIRRGE